MQTEQQTNTHTHMTHETNIWHVRMNQWINECIKNNHTHACYTAIAIKLLHHELQAIKLSQWLSNGLAYSAANGAKSSQMHQQTSLSKPWHSQAAQTIGDKFLVDANSAKPWATHMKTFHRTRTQCAGNCWLKQIKTTYVEKSHANQKKTQTNESIDFLWGHRCDARKHLATQLQRTCNQMGRYKSSEQK